MDHSQLMPALIEAATPIILRQLIFYLRKTQHINYL